MTNRARDRGATAVEVALLMPILLMLVMGIVDFGRALHAQITLTQAAREGVRVVALKQPDPATRTQNAATGLSGVGVAVTACPATSSNASAEVEATYTFEFVTPIGGIAALFGGGGYGDPIELSAKGVMPCEG
ncbi:pilus assembly protein [Lentzea sp. PSKA42]|uniref:Pilus assembly protein n=1 Tax=Lentzea indica TaxID=2604800 RepID=A0ABX1FCD5_9PSEU|nr:TadE/TadG family type IV pilus assembly protein [Lentzea indica]NKE56517.1 pilus assembly protein [Lentzea indica]